MPPQLSCWEIYNKEMSQLNHGHALWEPAPLSYYERIQPGDVGYIRTGCFHLLFSAGCPLGDRQLGVDVPSSFKELDVGPIVNRQPRAPGYLFTNNVRASRVRLKPPNSPPSISISMPSVSSPGTPSTLPTSSLLTPPPSAPTFPMLESNSTISFRLTGRQGAALVSKYRTYREDIQRTGTFEKYAKEHHASWVSFARETGHGNDINPVLVTGVDRTRDFAMMSYSSDDDDLRSEFTVSVSGVDPASAWGTWHSTGFVFTNCGPQLCRPPSSTRSMELRPAGDGDTEIGSDWYNQCVFVRYYTVRKRLGIPKVIKAGAGPHDLGPGSHQGGESSKQEAQLPSDLDSDTAPILHDNNRGEERSSATSVGSESNTIVHNVAPDGEDDFDAIADYVFQNTDADFVLLHHRDTALFRELGDNIGVSTQLHEKRPPITVDENGVAMVWGQPAPTVDIETDGQPEIPPATPLSIPRKTNEILCWTSKDPRQSQLFSSWGVVYRFQTDTNSYGRNVTSLWRAVRPTKEELVAKLEWASDGGLGRATIGKTAVPMADLVREDPRDHGWRIFNGPDGYQYRWGPDQTNSRDTVLQDPSGQTIARIREVRPTKYTMGDVYRELHYMPSAGAMVVMHPPMMDTVTVTAMLYQLVTAFGL